IVEPAHSAKVDAAIAMAIAGGNRGDDKASAAAADQRFGMRVQQPDDPGAERTTGGGTGSAAALEAPAV
ncbi:MAG: hypothetical protein ACE5ID_03755, partial [Acidobacteriota bacterium]